MRLPSKYTHEYMVHSLGVMFGLAPADVEEKFTYEEAALSLSFKKFENHCEQKAIEKAKRG